jgi:hypothetical protein
MHLSLDDGSPRSPLWHTEQPLGTSTAPRHLDALAMQTSRGPLMAPKCRLNDWLNDAERSLPQKSLQMKLF